MKRYFLLFFPVALVFITSCSESPQEAEVKNFVQSYCSVMQAAYATADFNLLVPATTEKELKKVFPVIQVLKATNNVMRTEIVEFKVKKVKLKENTATVKTFEHWRYWWTDKKTGAVTKPQNEEKYDLEYHLVRAANGQWKVDLIKNINE